MNAQAKLFVPVHVILLLIAYLSSERPSEHAHSHSLARAFADALKRRDVDECSGQIVRTSSCDIVTYRIFEQWKTMRACTFAQSRQSLCWCIKKKGCRWMLRPNCSYQFMWFSFLSHIWAVKDQASMHIRTVSPEPLLIALKRRDVDECSGQIGHTSSCDLGT